jgi:hypothetical protein
MVTGRFSCRLGNRTRTRSFGRARARSTTGRTDPSSSGRLDRCTVLPGDRGYLLIAQAATYESPFRIKHTLPPGFLTEHMALAWQADFSAAASYGGRRSGRQM